MPVDFVAVELCRERLCGWEWPCYNAHRMPFRRLWNRLTHSAWRESAPAQRLVVGLGNPGRAYGMHRHNIGWMVIAELAGSGGGALSLHRALLAKIATVNWGGDRIVLAQPTTYMNDSGEAVNHLLHWYKLTPDAILIVYDDKDLPLGKVRLRTQGSAGSHNGMTSIIQTLRTEQVPRLRVGIGPKPEGFPLKDFVLSPFSPHEEELRRQAVIRAAEAVKSFIIYGPEVTMQNYN